MTKPVLFIACLALAVAGTRYLWPRIEYREVQTEREVVRKDIRTIVRLVERPDGSKETVTETVDRSKQSSEHTHSVVKAAQSQWSAGLVLKYDAQRPQDPVYGLLVQKRMLGPIWLGASLSIDRQVSAIVSLEF